MKNENKHLPSIPKLKLEKLFKKHKRVKLFSRLHIHIFFKKIKYDLFKYAHGCIYHTNNKLVLYEIFKYINNDNNFDLLKYKHGATMNKYRDQYILNFADKNWIKWFDDKILVNKILDLSEYKFRKTGKEYICKASQWTSCKTLIEIIPSSEDMIKIKLLEL